METGLYEMELQDGRIFRVFTANKKQTDRLLRTFHKIGIGGKLTCVRNGIHTVKQFESIMDADNQQQRKESGK